MKKYLILAFIIRYPKVLTTLPKNLIKMLFHLIDLNKKIRLYNIT
jgi:hypothetical protein